VAQLKGRDLGEYLCIPVNMLKSGEEIFLDDWTVAEVEKALQVPVVIVKSSGQNLLDAMTGNIE
jgi:NifB/MoaA-like Fe-S oxidoreductase